MMKKMVLLSALCVVAMHPAYSTTATAQRFVLDYVLDTSQGEGLETITHVKVKDARTKALVQTITPPKPLPHREEMTGDAFVDINFDGYDDIMLFAEAFAGPNTRSDVWLYDTAQQRFVYHAEASDLTSIEVDAARKELKSASACCAGREWREVTYRWEKDTLVPVKKRTGEGLDDAPDGYEPMPNCKEVVWFKHTEFLPREGGKWKKQSYTIEPVCQRE